jgi:hypothetical protein
MPTFTTFTGGSPFYYTAKLALPCIQGVKKTIRGPALLLLIGKLQAPILSSYHLDEKWRWIWF